MRYLSARFVLGTLVVGTLCLLATPADAGPFRRRAANNDCCPQSVGYGYGSGYGGGYGYAPTTNYPMIQPTGGYLPTTGYPAIQQTGGYMVAPGTTYPTAGSSTPCCGSSGYTYAPATSYPTAGYSTPCCGSSGYRTMQYAPAYNTGTPCCGSGYANGGQTYYGGTPYAMPGVAGYPSYYQPGTYIPAGGVPTGGTGVPDRLPDTVTTEATKARITDGNFEPKTLTITPGTTVRWINDGKKPHTVTSDKDDWGSNEIPPGGEFTATFTKPGTFDYHCNLHEGMKGTIVVK